MLCRTYWNIILTIRIKGRRWSARMDWNLQAWPFVGSAVYIHRKHLMQDELVCHPISLKTFQSKTGYHTIIACKLITNTVFEKFVYRGFKVIFHIRQKLIVIDITLRYTYNNGVSVVQPAFCVGDFCLPMISRLRTKHLYSIDGWRSYHFLSTSS